jgi:hypothetical protein
MNKYLKLYIEVVPAYSNVKKPIYTTSGCYSFLFLQLQNCSSSREPAAGNPLLQVYLLLHLLK